MADVKTDSSSTPLSDDPVHPTNGGLSAKLILASHPHGAEPALDTLFHRTSRDSTARQTLHTERGRREPPVPPATVAIACWAAAPEGTYTGMR